MPRMHKGPQSLQEVMTIGKTFENPDASTSNPFMTFSKGNSTKMSFGESGGTGYFKIHNDATTTMNFDSGTLKTLNLLVGIISTIDSSALSELRSTTKGFLPPRMTTIQKNAISSPATGLVVFDTDLAKLCVYTGAAWETITSA